MTASGNCSSSDPISPADEKLIAGLASQAGLLMRNVRLTEELKAHLEELKAAQRRIVSAQDEERRRLERNIHDGAQQQLVALAVKLKIADGLFDRDAASAHGLMTQLQSETQDALEDLRDLARGIYPPLLADKGLVTALEAQARKATIEVTVHGDQAWRGSQDVEAAAYFCCLEALQNIAKYAEASHADVRIRQDDGMLTFEVADDGSGFDTASTGYGTGLQGMADRLAAQGGALRIDSSRGAGTRLCGRIPIEQAVTI